jgi:molybdate transport system substrate-binding protein
VRPGALFIAAALLCGPSLAEEAVTVAVASNFKTTAAHIASQFRQETGLAVRLSSGSTGKLYAQVVNGAPFDVFLAADAERPLLLERAGRAVADSRFTYAIGSLVLYSSTVGDCLAALHDPDAGYVAIANPDTAPYGAAAQQYLAKSGLLDQVAPRLVYGENIAQTWQFASTGNAVVAIVARAQLRAAPRAPACSSDVPAVDHDPLEQQAVLLDEHNEAAGAFLTFLRSAAAREIIARDGYEVPE